MTPTLSVPSALATLIALADAGDPDYTPAYVQGLVRVRPDGTNRGSFIEGVTDLDATRTLLTEQLAWSEVTADQAPKGATIPIATYFRAPVPDGMVGRTGILTFGSLTPEQRAQVQLVDGSHGPEMIMPWTGPLAETREVWAIVGRDSGALWTWYPGPLTPRLTATMADSIRAVLAGEVVDGEILDVINTLAVKLQTA